MIHPTAATSMSRMSLVAIVATFTLSGPEGSPPSQDVDKRIRVGDPREEGLRLLDGARRVLGTSAIDAAGGITVSLDGSFDLTTRLQGRSDQRPEPTPIAEVIAIDAKSDRLAYTIAWHNYLHSRQRLSEVYDERGRALYLDLLNETGQWSPWVPVGDIKERYARLVPQMLLADANRHRASVVALGRRAFGGDMLEAFAFATQMDDTLTVYLDPDSLRVRGASAELSMPLVGDTTMRWSWFDYAPITAFVDAPRRMTVHLGQLLLKDVRVDMRLGVAAGAFAAPASIAAGIPPEPAPPPPFVPYGRREPRVDLLAPGLHLVRDIRPGFHMLFVEFQNFVVAIDAPTGWYEMQQLPPMNWSVGDSVSALGAKYIRAIKRTVPTKPIRYVVLTHHHSDHIGGVRPFLDEGARVVSGAAAARLVRQAARAPFKLSPEDPQSHVNVAPAIDIVSGRRLLADRTMAMELIELPKGNPKAENYLMVYLPRQKTLYTSAFVYPLPPEQFPLRESIDLSIYFVKWLDRSGLDVERIVNVHGTGIVEPWQLERIRQLARGQEK